MEPSQFAVVLAAGLFCLGCGDSGSTDAATTSLTTTAAETAVPPTLLGALSPEEASELNRKGFLVGVTLDAARQWAQESGFRTVLVYDDPESVGLTAEFDPTRLVLVVEGNRVVVASAG
jgi:hypothetical protein